MDSPKKSIGTISDEMISIEEDIEEIIPTASSSSSKQSDKLSPEKLENLATKKRNLFDIEACVSKFAIDDDQLSGSGLAQHFFKLDELANSPNRVSKTKSLETVLVPDNAKPQFLSTRTQSIDETSESKTLISLFGSEQKEDNSKALLPKIIEKIPKSDIETKCNLSRQETATSSSELISRNPTVSMDFENLPEKQNSEFSNAQKNKQNIPHENSTKIIESAEPNESLTNQSTENDVSELIEEISKTDKTTTPSLDLSSKFFNKNKEFLQDESHSPISHLPLEKLSERITKDNALLKNASLKEDDMSVAQINLKTKTDTVESQNREISILIDDSNLSDPSFDVHDLSKVNKILNDTLLVPPGISDELTKNSISSIASSSQEDDMDALKEKILSVKIVPKSFSVGPHMARDISYEQNEDQQITVKQMEKIHADFAKDILEDITEESEKNTTSGHTTTGPGPGGGCEGVTNNVVEELTPLPGEINNLVLERINETNDYDNNTSNDFDSIISLNMIQMLENKVKELKDVVTAKDVCLNALNMQLDAVQRRESYATLESFRESFEKQPPSGRDSSSLATNSTEYKGLQDELTNKIFDFHSEIAQRDQIIEKLTDSLQQSIQIRENHQDQIDRLNSELQILRKQIADFNRKPSMPLWPSRIDQESNDQRLSEISIDLVSESEEDLDRQFSVSAENDDRDSRHSRDRQPLNDYLNQSGTGVEIFETQLQQFSQLSSQMSISKQIEQFQKYLNPEELRIFFMVQKKFDDFLSQELGKFKSKYDNEVKILADQLEIEKNDRDLEITRLKQLLNSVKNGSNELIKLRQELDEQHAKEMEDLRTYFEKKCADLEKQYSEEIFSQQSQRNDIVSDMSDHESLPHDDCTSHKQVQVVVNRTKEGSPRKRTREELYASPSHRQMTPTTVSPERHQRKMFLDDEYLKDGLEISVEELKEFYKEKIKEIHANHDKVVKNLNEKLKRFESKYADDEFMLKPERKHSTSSIGTLTEPVVVKALGQKDQNTSYIIIDEDEMTNDSNEIAKIAAEYERRLVEQVQFAKEDLIKELENQIQALLSETSSDDHHWPPELILLREKFTAKSQLEIAQLQIKHEEEMARMKTKYEKQLNRKIKRQSTFDLSRDLDQILNERDSLRDLSFAFRNVTSELAKCISICEDDFNTTFLEEMQHLSGSQFAESTLIQDSLLNVNESGDNLENSVFNQSLLKKSILETTLQKRVVPNVSSLLNVVDDPKLLSYISSEQTSNPTKSPTVVYPENFSLKDCIEKLKNEAQILLQLSENICQKKHVHLTENVPVIGSENNRDEKHDACAEDGLRRSPKKIFRANSMNESLLRTMSLSDKHSQILNKLSSLPPDLNKVINCELNSEDFTLSGGPVNELNYQVNELRNRLVKSESDKVKLQQELEATINRNTELGLELAALRDQLENLDSNREDYSEGYGLGEIKSPRNLSSKKSSSNFTQLQEKARNILGTPRNSEDGDTLLQLIEDFCREGDKVLEDGKKDRDDLQAQAERMEHQIKELTIKIKEYEVKKEKLEIELKASIDKIFVLREIISDLETQVETKSLNENVLNEKVKELESYANEQNHSIEALQNEIEMLKREVGQGYSDRTLLEDALRNSRPPSEQSALIRQLGEQLRDVATTLEQKTKILEALHQSVASISSSETPREDVSVQDRKKSESRQASTETVTLSPVKGSPVDFATITPRLPSLPIEEIETVFERLAKHTRVEEAAVKRIKDLEMHISVMKTAFAELQQERDILHDKMSEQMVRISALQTKLDEQRRRAEELQRIGSSDLNIRIHDLQNDVQNLTETLSARDKQILNLKNNLEQSKTIIDRQEAEIALGSCSDRSLIERVDKLENELKQKNEEIKKLREKIKSDMINKLALPDLMETMLADKNDEIDQLREQLLTKEKELQHLQNLLDLNSLNNNNNNDSSKDKEKSNSENGAGDAKLSARTLSDIVSISDFDEQPDVIRKAIPQQETNPLVATPLLPQGDSRFPDQTMNSPKLGIANLTEKHSEDLNTFNSLPPQPVIFNHPNFFSTDPSIPSNLSSVPSFIPRQINFSEFVDDTKLKESTPKQNDCLKDSEENNKLLRSKLDSAREELTELKISLEQITKEKAQTIENLQNQLEGKVQVLKELNIEKEQLKSHIADLEKQLQKTAELENDFKAKQEQFKKLENEFIELQLELGECQDKLDKKTENITDLEKQIKNLLSENSELKNNLLETQCSNKTVEEINQLNERIQKLSDHNNTLQAQLDELNALNFRETIALLNNQVEILTETVEDKDEILKKYENSFLEYEKKLKISEDNSKYLEEKISVLITEKSKFEELENDLILARTTLSEKSILYEKCLLDIKSLQKTVEKLKANLIEKDSLLEKQKEKRSGIQNNNNVKEIQQKLKTEKSRNTILEERLEVLETELQKLKSNQNSESSNKQLTLDEIAQQVEKELNYSAQLDSNILKAIESEEENNLDFKTDSAKLMERDLLNQLKLVKEELEQHKINSAAIQKDLESERKQSKSLKDEFNSLKIEAKKITDQLNQEKLQSAEIQQQDANIIEALQERLEEALRKEQDIQRQLDDEKEKCNRLNTQISVLQQTEVKKATYLLRSPPASPTRRSSSGSSESDNDMTRRLRSEIELLNAQNKRERERMNDLQKMFEREKSRFESELKDHIEYGENLKSKLDRITREKDLTEQEIEHLQEQSFMQQQEIESLTKRIVTLQETETRRVQRREKERYESTQNLVDLQDLKNKLQSIELEKEHLNKTIDMLRNDIERGAKRESKLAEALATQSPDATIPQQFLIKMKEMNELLSGNMKDLMDERKALQRKCEELENQLAISSSSGVIANNNNTDLVEKTNQLFGRLLRVESHRKALVHQKRYLTIALQSYQESEARTLALINGSDSILQQKKNPFKAAALAIIAIKRMKFIVKRWQNGKRIVSKSFFTVTQQKRALDNLNYYNLTPMSVSPPCREINNTVVLNHNAINRTSPPPQNQPSLLASATMTSTTPFQLQPPNLISDFVTNHNQYHLNHHQLQVQPQLHHHQHHQQQQQPQGQPQKFDWSRLKKQ